MRGSSAGERVLAPSSRCSLSNGGGEGPWEYAQVTKAGWRPWGGRRHQEKPPIGQDSELNSEKTRSAGQADKEAMGVLGSVSGSQSRNEK